jgi:thiol-disulfide isomerase/thioredoxin
MKISGNNVFASAILIALVLILSVILSGCGVLSRNGTNRDNTPGSGSPSTTDSSKSSNDVKYSSGSSSDKAAVKNTPEVKPFEGYKAPDFELEDLSGNKVKLSGLCGKTVVINFWSLDCPYCLAEMPEFDSFNSSKPTDVEVLMVNLDRDQKKLSTYIKNKGYKFTVLKDEKAKTLRFYLIRGVPTTIVVGKDGIVAARVEGPVTKQILGELVKTSPSNKAPVPS